MTTFNTIEELLEILDNNPQILSAVRSKILTDELIKLPHEFAEFRESTEEFQERSSRRDREVPTERFRERGVPGENREVPGESRGVPGENREESL